MNRHPALNASIGELLALFDDALETVRFPDVDRDILGASCEAVAQAHAQVEARQAALDEARSVLEAERAGLHKLARRAVEYARVYASDDAELLARIDELALPGAAPKRKKRKSRPKKKPTQPAAEDPQLALAKEDAA